MYTVRWCIVRTKQKESPYKVQFSVRPYDELWTLFEQSDPTMGIQWIANRAELTMRRAEKTRIWKSVSHFPWVQ